MTGFEKWAHGALSRIRDHAELIHLPSHVLPIVVFGVGDGQHIRALLQSLKDHGPIWIIDHQVQDAENFKKASGSDRIRILGATESQQLKDQVLQKNKIDLLYLRYGPITLKNPNFYHDIQVGLTGLRQSLIGNAELGSDHHPYVTKIRSRHLTHENSSIDKIIIEILK